MKFATQFDKHERVFSNAGSPIKILYAGHFDDEGVLDLVEKGKTNIYHEIQSHADSVDIHIILKRYQNGEIGVLNKVDGSYGDFTEMPKNYAEMLNLMLDKQAEFLKLPVEVKEKFGNSFERYMATAGTADWLLKMGFATMKEAQEPVQEPVQVDNAPENV